MKRILVTIIAGMGVALAPFATPITPEQALQRALEGIPSARMSAPAASSLSSFSLQRTFKTASQAPAIYIFRGANRTLVVAADDKTTPLLGIVDGNTEGPMPPQMEWWLSEYARQIDYMRENAVEASMPRLNMNSQKRVVRDPIEPLLKTTWYQDEPYNNMCPEIDGKKTYTGCVATAASQVMNYFKWPAQGTGAVEYDDQGTIRTLDYSRAPFDWDNMLDSYSDGYNQTQADAVAWLMAAVGHAAHMMYGTDGSGAYDCEMLIGAQEYFGYNELAQCMYRDFYCDEDWEKMIYDNLANVGPVYYAGSDGNMGHAFVCDGYSDNGYFHLNWGWGGFYDGYFLLDALYPDGQSIGG